MTLSVVIPVWSGTDVLEQMAVKLCKSVINDCDELIVCEDGPFSLDLEGSCTKYITHPKRLGHPQNLRSGIEAAKGDFIGILDFDVEIVRGSMRDLCTPGMFVEGRLLPAPSPKTGFLCWCSVTDRNTLMQYPITQTGELLDEWGDSIPSVVRSYSGTVEYVHHSGIGTREWYRAHGLAYENR